MASTKKDIPTTRSLKTYAFDPSQGRNLGNYMTLHVPYEKLKPGPVGKHLAVIDYDASNRCYYEPVHLDDPAILLRNGLDPSESNPLFHQQMVYAVASRTIQRFEFALGRKMKWAFRGAGPKGDPNKDKLRIFPHGMQAANAFYSRDLRAVVFGYFRASDTDAGPNLPGQSVFTCLSHDIIVHEMTHALIDGQRRYFLESTNPDTVAFHEAFADIVALFQHFSVKEALMETIQRTGGLIYRSQFAPQVKPEETGAVIQFELTSTNPMVELAKQFGEAMGMRAALRSALGTPPNSRDLERMFEPHDRGSILVAAVFDAFFTIYMKRTQDLIRIARIGGTATGQTDIHPDLANRLATEAAKTAEHFSNICIRAIDYCPPVDITFGDFLRAMITADQDLVTEDSHGYREALIKGFRLRGIRPEEVTSYAEESLRWMPPEEFDVATPTRWDELAFDLFGNPTAEQLKDSAQKLHKFASDNLEALQLTKGAKIAIHSFHPLHRVSPSGKYQPGVVAEIIQTREELLDPKNPKSDAFKYRGGITLVLDQLGNVSYVIPKRLGKSDNANPRLSRQREYYLTLTSTLPKCVYLDFPLETLTRFSNVHRGY